MGNIHDGDKDIDVHLERPVREPGGQPGDMSAPARPRRASLAAAAGEQAARLGRRAATGAEGNKPALAASPLSSKKRRHLAKENKAVVTVVADDEPEIVEVVDLDVDAKDAAPAAAALLNAAGGGNGLMASLVRRRALKRRQTSQSPVKGGSGSGGGVAAAPAPSPSAAAAAAQERRLSADSAVLSLSAKNKSGERVGGGSISDHHVLLGGGVTVKHNSAGDGAVVKGDKGGLRAMLISQLDLIKKQSEDIAAKDKRLRELQSENDKLRLRLRQMEDTQQRSTSVTSNSSTTPPAAAGSANSSSSSIRGSSVKQHNSMLQQPQPRSPPPLVLSPSSISSPPSLSSSPRPSWITARHIIVPQIQKRQSQDKSVMTDISDLVSAPLAFGGGAAVQSIEEGPKKKRRRRKKKEEQQQEQQTSSGETTAKSEVEGEAAPAKKKRRRRTKAEMQEAAKAKSGETDSEKTKEEEETKKKSKRKEPTFLECPGGGDYPLTRGDDHVERERREVEEILRTSTEVPGWRRITERLVTSYHMEGTEDVEDATLLARHSKLEQDEKRRKRWDAQRLREQRRLARLKATYQKSMWNSLLTPEGERLLHSQGQGLRSLLPDLEDITHICVTDNLPVSAFGLLAPTSEAVAAVPSSEEDAEKGGNGVEKKAKVSTLPFVHSDFSLPWATET